MAFYHGKTGKLAINGGAVKITGWNANESVDEDDTTNTEGNGYKEQLLGNKQIAGEFTGKYDSARKPTTSPAFTAGNQLTNLVLYLNTGVAGVTIPTADITGFRVQSEVKGVITFTCSFKSNGSYTWS